MSEIIIENLKSKDVNETTKLFHTILIDTFYKTFPEDAINKYKEDWQEDSVYKAVANKDKVMIVAKYKSRIIGLLFGSSLNGGVGSIIWVAVSRDQRGRGIGKLLCEKAENEYRNKGAHKIVLYTETLSGKRFYERIGYVHEGTHPKHWWGIDHYCLAKIL